MQPHSARCQPKALGRLLPTPFCLAADVLAMACLTLSRCSAASIAVTALQQALAAFGKAAECGYQAAVMHFNRATAHCHAQQYQEALQVNGMQASGLLCLTALMCNVIGVFQCRTQYLATLPTSGQAPA